ncbi:MAG TPA: calcium/proton exchanger [Candidatus Angelobacter sp.]|nr:calcium/proton exchanger [Candidatus Angelobacter sp.]
MVKHAWIASIWRRFPLKSGQRWLNIMLFAVPLAVVLWILHAPPLYLFFTAALGIVPLAGILGESTGALAQRTGPSIGGVLNATLGNSTELIIAIFAVQAGHIGVVKASLSGSIIGNLLLVLGLSIVAGGTRRDVLRFSRADASMNSTMLMIAVAALVMPAIFALSSFGDLAYHHSPRLEQLSLWASGILILLYLANLFFIFKARPQAAPAPAKSRHGQPGMKQAIISLSLATALTALLSEILVSAIEPVTRSLGMTELFIGVIIVALVGNAAEHSTAVIMAMQDEMDLAISVAAGSSTQIALFVAPVLVFLSIALGHPMTLLFNGFEIAGIFLSVLIVAMISSDGETHWMEGAELLALYAILAVAFYFVPD